MNRFKRHFYTAWHALFNVITLITWQVDSNAYSYESNDVQWGVMMRMRGWDEKENEENSTKYENAHRRRRSLPTAQGGAYISIINCLHRRRRRSHWKPINLPKSCEKLKTPIIADFSVIWPVKLTQSMNPYQSCLCTNINHITNSIDRTTSKILWVRQSPRNVSELYVRSAGVTSAEFVRSRDKVATSGTTEDTTVHKKHTKVKLAYSSLRKPQSKVNVRWHHLSKTDEW